jgi:glyoxylate/hydroxypyruvate reductase A
MVLMFLSTPDRAAVGWPVLAAGGHDMIVGECEMADPGQVMALACWTRRPT